MHRQHSGYLSTFICRHRLPTCCLKWANHKPCRPVFVTHLCKWTTSPKGHASVLWLVDFDPSCLLSMLKDRCWKISAITCYTRWTLKNSLGAWARTGAPGAKWFPWNVFFPLRFTFFALLILTTSKSEWWMICKLFLTKDFVVNKGLKFNICLHWSLDHEQDFLFDCHV